MSSCMLLYTCMHTTQKMNTRRLFLSRAVKEFERIFLHVVVGAVCTMKARSRTTCCSDREIALRLTSVSLSFIDIFNAAVRFAWSQMASDKFPQDRYTFQCVPGRTASVRIHYKCRMVRKPGTLFVRLNFIKYLPIFRFVSLLELEENL